jgi:hypothetical protein
MRKRRTLLFLGLFLIIVLAVGSVVYYRIARPARAVLLLPDGNFLLYVNFSPAHFFELGPIPGETDPGYQDFVQQTGFHFEHDLDTLAVSQRDPSSSAPESSAVFTGHFDHDRLTNYLQRRSSGTEKYGDQDIFLLHHEDHIVRACLLDARTVAVTNMESAEPMHTIIDKSGHARAIGKGPFLIANYYRYVPFGSLAWAMLRLPAQPAAKQRLEGFDIDFLQNTVSIASVRYTGSIRLKAEVISENDAAAQRVGEAANIYLVLARGAGEWLNPGGSDKDVKAAFDSIQVEQQNKRTVVTMTIPQEFLKKMAARISH